MHGHDAHLVAGDFHVAFDFGLGITQPGDKALQRRRVAPLVVEREIEELVQRIVGLDAEPAEEALSRAAGAQQLGVERKRRLAPRILRQLVEASGCVGELFIFAGFLLERRTQRDAAAVPGDR